MPSPSFLDTLTWAQFEKKLASLNKKEKGDYFERLTKYYFKIDPKLQSFYDEVWLLSELPTKEREFLGIPSHDLGIDLIGKKGTEYHAIQCKYHTDKNSSVTFNEVSTFISMLEGNSKLSKGFICSTAASTSKNLSKVINKTVYFILNDTWSKLDEVFFKKVKALELGKAFKPDKPLSPRPHQKKALKDAVKYFEREDAERGKLIFPCGAGKSLTGFWITQKLKSKATLIAVPSLSLVKQTLEVYLQEIAAHKKSVKWLCICSDEGIGRSDDVVFYTQDLGVPCETDPDYIEDWLQKNREEELIVFTTYQSGRIIAEISQKVGFTFDLGIFDEAHKTVGSNKKLFSHLLFEKSISIRKRVFMTATERFYAGSKDDIISMDDEDIYGDTFTQMSFKEAIDSKLLTDYKVITIEVQKSEISEFIRTNNLIQLDGKWGKETEARSLASMLALRKAMKKYDIKNAVSFHSSIEKAVRNKELQTHITDTYNFKPIDSYTVSGKQRTTERNAIVQEFAESEQALITNAKCLTEGVDVPNIDCIVFSDPRKSKIDIVQALGRALRKKEGKEWGYVVLPVIYNDETEEIDNENFNEILSVVRGLASNDERIVDYFRDKNKEQKHRLGEPSQFQLEVITDHLDEAELSKELEIRLWEKLSRFNWMPFEEAREIVREHAFSSSTEYIKAWKRGEFGSDIPAKPQKVYRDSGFISMPDFLGYKSKFQEWWSFEQARKFVRSLKLKSGKELVSYWQWGLLPREIPADPRAVYSNAGWISMNDFIGTKPTKFAPYKIALKYVRSLELSTHTAYYELVRSNKAAITLPMKPYNSYAPDGFISMDDFLGIENSRMKSWMEYVEAQKFVSKLGISSMAEYHRKKRQGGIPDNIPRNPNKVYENKGWQSSGHWLGTGRIADQIKVYMPFKEAREYIREFKFSSASEYKAAWRQGKLSSDIPANPQSVYRDNGFISMPDFLGYESKFREWWSFEKARKFARTLGFTSNKQWRTYSKTNEKPSEIPASPSKVYRDKGWIGWKDFLGWENIKPKKEYRPFRRAKEFAMKNKISSSKDWYHLSRSKELPSDLPAHPERTYKRDWRGWGDFLGKD